jgi:glutaredoxin
MDNMSVDAGYSSSNSSYTDYYNEFVAINNYLMGCSYVDYDKIAYDGDDLFYFFDYYDKFIKYDKEGHDTYYENQKQPDGSVITVPYIYVNNVKTYITEDEIRPIYTEYAPPEVLGYPVIIGSYVYAVTLEAEDPKLYRFSMSRKHWESLGAIPYRYY